MSRSLYTLIHEPLAAAAGEQLKESLFRVQMNQPRLADSLNQLRPGLRRTLLNALSTSTGGESEQFPGAMRSVNALLDQAPETGGLVTVGVWDLDAYVPRRDRVIEALNAAQKVFVFFNVSATVPAGMAARPERVTQWVEERLKREGKRLPAKDAKDMAENVIADDFFERAEPLRTDLGLDYLAGVTRGMIAGEKADGGVFYNYFARWKDKNILVSTYEVRDLASQAKRPFEIGVANLIVVELLDAMHKGKLLHDAKEPNTGSLFDFNADRSSFARTIQEARIDADDARKIAPRYRQAALALATVLRTYSAETAP